MPVEVSVPGVCRPAGWRHIGNLRATIARSGRVPPVHAFFGAESPLSQWHLSPFTVGRITYQTAEHWMMAGKAALFGDRDAFERVVAAPDPASAKRVGRQVAGFEQARWDAACRHLVYVGNVAKFGQCPNLAESLLATGSKVLVEAAANDPIWGAGLGMGDPGLQDPRQWPGQNMLGFVLMDVRDMLRLQRGV